MARSPKDDPRYNEIKHSAWNYHAENTPNGPAPGLNQPPIVPNSNVINDNMYVNASFANDVYLNKHVYNSPTAEAAPVEDKIFNNMPNMPRNQNYGNAMLNLGNGQMVRVYYDENNKQLIFPVSGQYELFNHNQGLCDTPHSQPPLFTLNKDYPMHNNMQMPPTTVNQNMAFQENMNPQPTSNFLKDLLGNLEPNSTGTYSPFGQNYPLNHPEASNLNIPTNPVMEPKSPIVKPESPKRNENSPLADTSTKKRIIAEVKPMRPSYSDVLAKNAKNNSPTESNRKTKPQSSETKPINIKPNIKQDKPMYIGKQYEDNKPKMDKKHTTLSSGSESGDHNTDDNDKHHRPNKKTKSKRNSLSRKWSSLEDFANEEDLSYTHSNESQFVFIEDQEKPTKKEKKTDQNKVKQNKPSLLDDDFNLDEDFESSEFVLNEEQTSEVVRTKKKKDRSYHKIPKPTQDKKKVNLSKSRRNKPGYLGVAQNYLEHWGEATWKAVIWFIYLLSDICRMSLHLSFDLCTSVFTQTYVSSQAVWRSSKDWLSKIGDNKYLSYIDRKLGHTWFGFWRKLRWFKKETEVENGNDSTKLNANIPLPATGEEAMKRLLACKGKDPYSILGVSVDCTDEDIKRYYRRQAFLVHPDKNQQPGAEEAFKILQHAFDLIGEPERREAYSRRAAESLHAEAAWAELNSLLAQLHHKMEFAANTIRCTNCGRRHKRVQTDRPCYAARYCAQCKIRHSAKEGDIWAESSMMGLLVMYYACMDGAVYQITQWASCQKKNLRQLRPDCHVVQYRIVLGNKAAAATDINQKPTTGHEPNLEEFLNSLYSKSGASPGSNNKPPADSADAKKRRNKKPKV